VWRTGLTSHVGAVGQAVPTIPLAQLLDDEIVFRRTPAGQREAVLGDGRLDPTATRVLLLVNGVIPLRDLLDMLQLNGGHVGDVILRLVDGGLITVGSDGVPPKRPAPRRAR
jgi:hypothetical protein